MRKTTDELINELQDVEDINKFMVGNAEEMLNISLAEYLTQLLERYHLRKSDVFKRAGMEDRSYGYDLFSGNKSNPARDKVIQICLGFPLTVEEAQRVLRCGGLAPLYPRDPRDAYILYALKAGYDIYELNRILYDNEIELILLDK